MAGVLDGKIALVTGAGRGNGAAIALGFAAAGARVVATDIDGETAAATARRIGTAGGTAWSFALDVADAAACDRLAARVAAEIGAVAILVNNAGILVRGGLAEPGARAAWRRTLDVNVDGTFNATMAFLPALKATRGSIINLGSINSFVAPPNSAAYATSKGAIAQFTRALANELAPDGIRVNALAPGIIATEMSAATRNDPERLARFMLHVPMRRVGEPQELVGPAIFLASPAASYVTGVVLPVDGGYLTL
jgi:NAD(P)-dependent dehydrogenase (short-subunit alcohol dehydrogenase family)